MAVRKSALIVIDLQNDFIDPNGPFGSSAVNANKIVANLTKALPLFRAQADGNIVIWIKSNYSNTSAERLPPKRPAKPGGEKFENVPMNNDFLAGSHVTFPLCVPGTKGHELIPEIQSLIGDGDLLLEKTYFSAFTDTKLGEILQGFDAVHICGLMTNVCVRATATDAFFHNKDVFIWTDCLGFRIEKHHFETLAVLEKQYKAKLVVTEPFLAPSPKKPCLYIVNGSIPSWRVLMALYEKGVDFRRCRLKVMSKPKETKSAHFLAINPRGKTPTFVDADGTVIYESLAILHYLEAYYPDTALLPSSVDKAAFKTCLQRMQESQNLVDVYEPLEDIVFKTTPEDRLQHVQLAGKTLGAIDRELGLWERYLGETKFAACDDRFTLADCAFYPAVAYLVHRGLKLNRHPNIQRYYQTIKTMRCAELSHPEGWKPHGGAVNVFGIAESLALARFYLPLFNCNQKMTSTTPSWQSQVAGTYGSGDTFLLLNVFPDDVADKLFYTLRDEVKWGEMMQRGSRVPRDIAIQGTLTQFEGDSDSYEPIYRHPADEQPPLVSWTPGAAQIRQRVSEILGQELNHALIQYYRTGRDNIGEHSDKTLDILRSSNIVNYSLGAARKMYLKHKTRDEPHQIITLPHNSLFVLGWKTNREWLHSIREDRRAPFDKTPEELAFDEQRISLTLRTIATFRNLRTGRLHGQGAKSKSRSRVDETDNVFEDDSLAMLKSFSAENHQSSDFDWDLQYGAGFDAVNFKVLNDNM